MRRRGGWDAFAPFVRLACVAAGCVLLAQCSGKVDSKYGVSASPRVVAPGQPVPKGGGVYRVGKPYVIAGRTYVPSEDPDYRAEGLASWYGDDFHGRLTANGEVYDMHSLSAAHPTLPLPSYARVTNLRNGRSIIVRINDRGPFVKSRVIDLSARTANVLGFRGHGLARVRVEYVGRAPLSGSDDRMLLATLRHNGPAPAPSRVMLASAKPFVPRRAPALAGDQESDPLPVRRPPSRPADADEIDAEPVVAIAARPRPRPVTTEVTAAARIAQTLGPAPDTPSLFDPAGAPSSGVLGAPAPQAAPVTAFSSPRPAPGAAYMSGRGLY